MGGEGKITGRIVLAAHLSFLHVQKRMQKNPIVSQWKASFTTEKLLGSWRYAQCLQNSAVSPWNIFVSSEAWSFLRLCSFYCFECVHWIKTPKTSSELSFCPNAPEKQWSEFPVTICSLRRNSVTLKWKNQSWNTLPWAHLPVDYDFLFLFVGFLLQGSDFSCHQVKTNCSKLTVMKKKLASFSRSQQKPRRYGISLFVNSLLETTDSQSESVWAEKLSIKVTFGPNTGPFSLA